MSTNIFLIALLCSATSFLHVHAQPVKSNENEVAGPVEREGFHVIDSRRYYINEFARISWLDAVAQCAENGMVLMSLETQAEHNAVRNYLNSIMLGGTTLWTSGLYVDGTWVWYSTGEGFGFTAWADGQPNDIEFGDVYVYTQQGLWFDGGVDAAIAYMCEESDVKH